MGIIYLENIYLDTIITNSLATIRIASFYLDFISSSLGTVVSIAGNPERVIDEMEFSAFSDNITQMIPAVAHLMIPLVVLQMISVFCGKMLDRMLSGGFAPPAAWQTTAVLFMVLSAARKRYCLRAMIRKGESIRSSNAANIG